MPERGDGARGPSWYSAAEGLFSERPHLYLMEHFWDAPTCTTTTRYFIVDAATGSVARYTATAQAYTREDFRDLLVECGFGEVTFYPSLTGAVDETQSELFAITARKQAGRA